MAALSSDFGYFSQRSMPKVHLNPLPLVVSRGNVRGGMVKPSFAGCITIGILKKAITNS